ncbi:hypothetical protein Q0M94_02170 [Deinococcus radiomollis]|uniref:hypothetical protein n=1 Tax=Deinococcus radiomollis TaxID=468916 RepID=UPI0038925DBC
MTQPQEPAPAPHSQWKYTGEPLGTIFLDSQPLANITESGQLVNAADDAAAANLERSGYFQRVAEVTVPAPDAAPVLFAAPIVPIDVVPAELPQAEPVPADHQEHE